MRLMISILQKAYLQLVKISFLAFAFEIAPRTKTFFVFLVLLLLDVFQLTTQIPIENTL